MAFLYQIRADGMVIEHREIGDEPVVVGRGHGADLEVDDRRLSRAHFVVAREGDAFIVRDLNSTNGTWVHGRRVSAVLLKPHDHIGAGRTRFLFEPGLTTAMEALEGSRAGDTEIMA
ncbi:MAG TPA: FHA domain-containing protein [Verrucomicrobiae bacterium]|nr:FHA domain-containing protein [Verrucomicrobiae bacterium]